jgi:hypothetical protein
VGLDRRAVAAQGRRLAAAVVLDVAQVLGGGVGECGTGPCQAGQRAAPRLVQCRPEPVLGEALREVTGRGPTALVPCGPELLLDLSSVGEPVFGVPRRSSLAIDTEDMPRRRPEFSHRAADRRPIPGHIGDMFQSWHTSRNEKPR